MATGTSMRIDLAPASGAPPAACDRPDDLALAGDKAPVPDGQRTCPEGQGDFTLSGEKAPLPPGEGFGVRGAMPRLWRHLESMAAERPAGLARFILAGGALGFAGFWLAPVTIDTLSGYYQAVFGATLFLFIGWTFIDIHHYFMDNVIRRRENLETVRHLFTPFGRPDPRGTGRPTHASAGTAGTLRNTPTQGAIQ